MIALKMENALLILIVPVIKDLVEKIAQKMHVQKHVTIRMVIALAKAVSVRLATWEKTAV